MKASGQRGGNNGGARRRFFLAWAAGLALGAAAASAQSSRPGWGAVPYADADGTGTTFRLWAPGAASVNVAGSFNGWNTGANPLTKESAASGAWSADVAAARTNDAYKYVVNGSLWRSDPRSRAIDSADHNNSTVLAAGGFDWGDDSAGITNAGDLVIYEAHVGTFGGMAGTFALFTNRLGYLAELGVTAIELMPVNEFPSSTSWGYNPAYPFAVEKNYGPPDALKSLVRQAHRRGILTFLDVVHNHWDGGSSLWEIDGTTPGPYFYASDPYTYTAWGPRPDYGNPAVRETINDTFRMWLEEYHISGFRWDAPKHIIYTTNGLFIPDGLTMATNALRLMATNYSGVWNIAEDTKEIGGFDRYWDLAFRSEIQGVLVKGSDSQRDMQVVARNVAGVPGRILFTESHDTAGDLNNGQRLPVAIQGADPGGYYARKRSALGAVLALTSPGTPMILQGQELLETNQFSDTRAMDWTRTNSQAGTWRLYRDLIRLRRNLDGVSAGLTGDSASVYQVDNTKKLVAYSRQDSVRTGNTVVVVANFASATRTNFAVQFPEEGAWYALFNGDSTDYAADYGNAGSFEVAAAGSPATGAVTIGPYSALIFSRTPRTGMVLREAATADLPAGNGNGVPDPGETIREQLVLWNKSSTAATGVVATLSALSAGVSVEQGVSGYAPMAANGQGTNQTAFAYRLDRDLACGSVLRFQLETAFNGQVLTSLFDRVVGSPVSQPPATNEFRVETPTEIPDNATVYSDLEIAAAGDPAIVDIDVLIRIDHTYDRDLVLALQHPDGSEVLLSNRRGRSGDGFGTGACGAAVYTVLDQSAEASITNGVAPFAGSYRPESTLDALAGKPLNGTWRLRMTDVDNYDAGTNLCWGLRVVHEQRGYACAVFSNRPPTAFAAHLQLSGSGPTNFALGGGDEDGQPLAFEARRAPAHGLFTLLSAATGESVYAPVHGYVGTDTFDFVVSDGVETSAAAVVTLVMPPPADVNSNGLPDDWETRYYTNLTSALPDEDSDGDGASNEAEYRANTDPRDGDSVLRLFPAADGAGRALRWNSAGGTRYRVEYSLDPAAEPFRPVPRPLAEEFDPAGYGAPSILSFADDFLGAASTNAERMRVYRLRILNE